MRQLLATLLLCLAACGPMEEGAFADDELASSGLALSFSTGDAALVLALVNYPGTTAATLDTQAGLDRRAAQNIIARRDGADGRAPSADDQPFSDLATLDAVPYVGDAAFERLLSFARENPAPAGAIVEGITFAGWQAETVLWGVNQVPAGTLNGLLDDRAAQNIIAARPLASLEALGAVALVGPSALTALRGQSTPWWSAMKNAPAPLAGTFDGVAFDEAAAKTALALANEQMKEALVAHDIAASPAAALIAARPFASMAAVAAVTGVGTATMQALHKWATTPVVADPVAHLRDTLAPLTADLWFPSETDARMLFVSADGIGNTPITASLIREKLTAQHDALLPQVMWVDPSDVSLAGRTPVEELSAVAYLNHIIDAADPNDPDSLARAARLAQVRDALTSQLTDLEVFRFGRVNISVFIVGRTSNGALAGLLTGQVET